MSGAVPRRRRERAGRRAERIAAWWLRLRGFAILATRWRAKVGEIDVVARRGDLVVFVEVKRRASFADAAAAVTADNRVRVTRAAEHFLARHPDLAGCDARFDVVLLAPWAPPRHLPGAFDAPDFSGRSRTAPRHRRSPH